MNLPFSRLGPRTKSIAWFVMTLMALAISAYGAAMVFIPQMRPELVQSHFSARPIIAFAHFLGGAVALAVGAFQLNGGLRGRFLNAHRWFGRLYVIAILAGGISGLIMSTSSMGGLTAHLGFGALAVAWLATTLNAYRHIRKKNLNAHQDWMIRSYALTLAAVTLRIYLPMSQVTDSSMAVAYPIIAWVCWVPNLVVAEWFVRPRRKVSPLTAQT